MLTAALGVTVGLILSLKGAIVRYPEFAHFAVFQELSPDNQNSVPVAAMQRSRIHTSCWDFCLLLASLQIPSLH